MDVARIHYEATAGKGRRLFQIRCLAQANAGGSPPDGRYGCSHGARLVEHETPERLVASAAATRAFNEVILAVGASQDAGRVLGVGTPGLTSRRMKKASKYSV